MAKPKRKFLIERWAGNRGFHVHVPEIELLDFYTYITSLEGVAYVVVLNGVIAVNVSPIYDVEDIEAEVTSWALSFEVPEVFKEEDVSK